VRRRRFSLSLSLPALVLAIAALGLVGCDGPGRVQFDGGRCFKDGTPLTLDAVEAEQTHVARRIASRQPWFAIITIGVVLIAAASNADRALLLVRARHAQGHRPLSEQLREALDRQRENPLRFSVIVGASLALIVVGGGAYVYLDVDKRASERALAMLQFCHLALRTQEEEGVLDEQKHNLEAIQSTAGDIRTLVGKLPPAEQRKAQLIVEEMNTALAKQGKVVGEYATRTDEAEKNLSSHTVAMEKGLASVEGDLAGLRSLPENLKDLETAAHRIDQTTTAFDARFDEIRTREANLDAKLDALLARPGCAPPAPVAAPKGSASASSAVAATPPGQSPAVAPLDPDGGKGGR
jgi:hypothetical protein